MRTSGRVLRIKPSTASAEGRSKSRLRTTNGLAHPARRSSSTMWLPRKPAPPVTTTFLSVRSIILVPHSGTDGPQCFATAVQSALQICDIGLDHHPNQFFERHDRLPAQYAPSF